MEVIKKTMNVEDASGWYLTQNEKRYWMEDFKDEESDEITSVERNEIICQKGSLINEIIASLLKENGIETVIVSNVPILGEQDKISNLWETVMNVRYPKGANRKKSYFLIADCPSDAETFIANYFELNVDAKFELVKVNKLDFNKVIKMYETERDEYEEDGKKHVKWYKCQIYSMVDDDDSGEKSAGMKNVLVQATDFEKAIAAIKAVMNRDEYESIYSTLKLLQELNIVDVFIPDESVDYYSNEEV